MVREDRLAFEQATRELDEIVSRTLAHRSRAVPTKTTIAGIDGIFEIFGNLLTKYLRLLQGADLVSVEPVPQYDTMAPFMFPWHPEAYAEWAKTQEP